jgi:hypothetical protein
MTRLTTRAQLDPCPRCRALTIRALDAPIAAIDTRLDPVPLDVAAELAARLQGRWTYDLFTIAGRHEIAERDLFRIQAPRRFPVLATHTCPGAIPASALRALRKKTARKKTNERPPF